MNDFYEEPKNDDDIDEQLELDFKESERILPNNSKSLLGQIYDSITLLLGMNPAKHQYKIMGLAPFASEFHKKGPRKIFMDSLKVKNLNFIRSKNMTDYFFYFKEKLKMFRFDGIAGGLQDFLEIRYIFFDTKTYSISISCLIFILINFNIVIFFS